ncbi:MAG: cation-translocating P-type ATPase C-terminal domain-containing protein, partial [Spirochaetaceae bacterium]|nr:cation-translocating P-type ATPase C-terminal domain-containing protein [Spirochaetaceae bacterium]
FQNLQPGILKSLDIPENAVKYFHELGQTMAFLVLGWTSLMHIFTVRSRISVFKRTLKDNPQLPISVLVMFLTIGGLAAFTPIASKLGLMPMSGYHWLIALGITLLPMTVAEYGKFWDNYKYYSTEKNRVEQQKIH